LLRDIKGGPSASSGLSPGQHPYHWLSLLIFFIFVINILFFSLDKVGLEGLVVELFIMRGGSATLRELAGRLVALARRGLWLLIIFNCSTMVGIFTLVYKELVPFLLANSSLAILSPVLLPSLSLLAVIIRKRASLG
jgi:hypothetical protein